MTPQCSVGLEWWQRHPDIAKDWGRCGLLCNQSSATYQFTPAWEIAQGILGPRLKALFGPQHGFAGTAQDNMIETGHAIHLATGLPVFSLYSETREPTAEMLSSIDTLVIDLQIVGCRIYTWKSTIAGCLRAAKKHGKKVVILDRPNPMGGTVIEGRVLDPDAHSFVGQFATPMRHGLTAAESARFFNAQIGADLDVVPLSGWDPRSYWYQLGRPWILTSPNLPTPDPVYVYPGTVMLEGTNISEGRGTGLPFQLIGAPYIKSGRDVIGAIGKLIGQPPGVHLREASFEPTSQKWRGQTCHGLQIHVVNPEHIRSYRLTLALIKAFMDMSSQFEWKSPPYEYDYETLPIKLIVGSRRVESHISREFFDPNEDFWSEGIASYIEAVRPYLLYDRTMQMG